MRRELFFILFLVFFISGCGPSYLMLYEEPIDNFVNITVNKYNETDCPKDSFCVNDEIFFEIGLKEGLKGKLSAKIITYDLFLNDKHLTNFNNTGRYNFSLPTLNSGEYIYFISIKYLNFFDESNSINTKKKILTIISETEKEDKKTKLMQTNLMNETLKQSRNQTITEIKHFEIDNVFSVIAVSISTLSIIIIVLVHILEMRGRKKEKEEHQIETLKQLSTELDYLAKEDKMNVEGCERDSHLYWYKKSIDGGKIPCHQMLEINLHFYISQLNSIINGISTTKLKEILLFMDDALKMTNNFSKIAIDTYCSEGKPTEKVKNVFKVTIGNLKENKLFDRIEFCYKKSKEIINEILEAKEKS